MTTTATSFRLRDDVHDKLKVLSAYQDRSQSNMLKNLVEQEYNRLLRELGSEEVAALEDRVLEVAP